MYNVVWCSADSLSVILCCVMGSVSRFLEEGSRRRFWLRGGRGWVSGSGGWGGWWEDSTDEERRLWQHPLPRSDYTFPLSGVWLLTPQLSDLMKMDEMKLPFSSLLHQAPPVPLQTWPLPLKRCIIQQIICCRYLSMSAFCSIRVRMVFSARCTERDVFWCRMAISKWQNDMLAI